jgi:hypothetical protein
LLDRACEAVGPRHDYTLAPVAGFVRVLIVAPLAQEYTDDEQDRQGDGNALIHGVSIPHPGRTRKRIDGEGGTHA